MDDLMYVRGQNGQILANFDRVERSCCHLSPPFINFYYSHLNYFNTRACWGTLVSLIMMKINIQSLPPPSPQSARRHKWNFNWKLRKQLRLLTFLYINQCHAAHFLSQIY